MMHTDENRLRRSGLTQLEIVISSVFVSLVFVTALHSFSVVLATRSSASDRARAESLARQLLVEITALPYEDADSPGFGPEATEMGIGRTAFDDVDDYHGWTASPPELKDGTQLSKFSGWQRSVVVEWVEPLAPDTTATVDKDVKRVKVTVKRNGITLATRVSLSSREFN